MQVERLSAGFLPCLHAADARGVCFLIGQHNLGKQLLVLACAVFLARHNVRIVELQHDILRGFKARHVGRHGILARCSAGEHHAAGYLAVRGTVYIDTRHRDAAVGSRRGVVAIAFDIDARHHIAFVHRNGDGVAIIARAHLDIAVFLARSQFSVLTGRIAGTNYGSLVGCRYLHCFLAACGGFHGRCIGSRRCDVGLIGGAVDAKTLCQRITQVGRLVVGSVLPCHGHAVLMVFQQAGHLVFCLLRGGENHQRAGGTRPVALVLPHNQFLAPVA